MTIKPQILSQLCYENNILFHAGVPCSLLSPITNTISTAENMRYVNAAIEGEAVALAAGAWLAGVNSAVWIQNSGLGNTINPITSLLNTFEIPILLISSRRGKPGEDDEPQHTLMGEITESLFKMCKIDYALLTEVSEVTFLFDKVSNYLNNLRQTYGIIVDKNCVEKTPYVEQTRLRNKVHGVMHELKDNTQKDLPSRFKYLKSVVKIFDKNTPIIATTGKTGRELYTLRDTKNHFYMVGSMGYASSIGLGVSLNTSRNIVVIDGDGALLMNMGTLATIGNFAPKNLIHIIIDNEKYESTGGQPTTSSTVNFAEIALNTGYAHCFSVNTQNGFETACKIASVEQQGPYLIHVKASTQTIKDLARPSIHPSDTALRFREFLAHD